MPNYIDKDTLLQDMKERLNNVNDSNYVAYRFGYELAIRRIENEPIVDVEEVEHAKWIYKCHHEMMGHAFQCSVCERWVFTNFPKHIIGEYPYCHCGAKMESVEGLEEEE